jgi:hypothetical protein
MTTRRTFLGAAAGIASSSVLSSTARARSPADHRLIDTSDVIGRDYEMAGAFSSVDIERYDEEGDIGIRTTRNDPSIAASVYVAGEWGSAGVSLTPDQAEALATALLAAADEWEGEHP